MSCLLPFEIQQTASGARYELALAGELDMASAPELGRKVTELCEAGALRVVVDLREVTFIDSSGLREILAAKAACAARRAEFWVVPSKHPAPRRLFEVAGVDGHIPWQQAGASRPLPAA